MGFFDKLKKINIFSSFGSELTDDFYDELEESLILADTGMDTTLELGEELRRRGVPREHWDAALQEVEDWEEGMDAFLRKRLGGTAPDPKDLKRASDALARRGYGWGEINAALRRYGAEIEEE